MSRQFEIYFLKAVLSILHRLDLKSQDTKTNLGIYTKTMTWFVSATFLRLLYNCNLKPRQSQTVTPVQYLALASVLHIRSVTTNLSNAQSVQHSFRHISLACIRPTIRTGSKFILLLFSCFFFFIFFIYNDRAQLPCTMRHSQKNTLSGFKTFILMWPKLKKKLIIWCSAGKIQGFYRPWHFDNLKTTYHIINLGMSIFILNDNNSVCWQLTQHNIQLTSRHHKYWQHCMTIMMSHSIICPHLIVYTVFHRYFTLFGLIAEQPVSLC